MSLIINTPMGAARAALGRGQRRQAGDQARAAACQLRGLRRAQQHQAHRSAGHGQHDPRPRGSVARGGLARRDHRDAQAVGALA